MVADLETIAGPVGATAAEHAGVLGVYLFGSRAKGDSHEGSDVDLGVLFDHRATLDEILDLETAFEQALGRKVDVVDVGRSDAFLALEIIRGERIWEGDGLRCDHFDLYVMRRAGDLAPFERERRRMLLTPRSRSVDVEVS